MLKKILAIACTLIMLFSMSAFALEADTVLTPTVINGDFSDGTNGWNPSLNATLKVPTEGDYAGALEVSYGGDKAYSTAEQVVSFDYVVGKKYTLEFKYANPNGISAKVIAANGSTWGAIDTNSTFTIPATVNAAWTTAKVTFVTPEKADEPGVSALNTVLIWLANYGRDAAKPIYYDDVKLYETPLIANGDFENGIPTEGYTDVTSKIAVVTGDAANAHTGSAYLKMAKAGGGRYTFAVNCAANTPYKLTYWFKFNHDNGASSSGYPKVGVGASVWDENPILDDSTTAGFYTTIGNVVGADTWIKRTHYFTTPADTTKIYIKFFSPGTTQNCYYDDIQLEVAENKVELQNFAGANGEDVTNLSAPLYAKARFIPKTAEASAMLVAVVFDESKGTKQLEYIDVKPYSTTTGAATTLELTISGYESFAGKAVEVYLWDSADGLKALTKKLRRSQNAAA